MYKKKVHFSSGSLMYSLEYMLSSLIEEELEVTWLFFAAEQQFQSLEGLVQFHLGLIAEELCKVKWKLKQFTKVQNKIQIYFLSLGKFWGFNTFLFFQFWLLYHSSQTNYCWYLLGLNTHVHIILRLIFLLCSGYLYKQRNWV